MVEKLRKGIPGGRARGRNVKHYLPQFAQIFSNFLAPAQDFPIFRTFWSIAAKKTWQTPRGRV